MSNDTYQLDRLKHGGLHIDRYNKRGQHVGKYRLDGAPIAHGGVTPPPIPKSDREQFEREAAKARTRSDE